MQTRFILFFLLLPLYCQATLTLEGPLAFQEQLRKCQLLWVQSKDFSQAEALMQELREPSPFIDEEIQQERLRQMVRELYTIGVQNDNLELLCHLYPWMVNLHVELSCRELLFAVNNHRADAESLFVRKQFKEAMLHLKWALLLSANDLGCRKLMGVVLFKEKRYKEAADHLKHVEEPLCTELLKECLKKFQPHEDLFQSNTSRAVP